MVPPPAEAAHAAAARPAPSGSDTSKRRRCEPEPTAAAAARAAAAGGDSSVEGDPGTESDFSSSTDWEGRLVGSRFEILDRVGQGSHADCFRGKDRLYKEQGSPQDVCLKIEDTDFTRPKLLSEWNWLRALQIPCKGDPPGSPPRTPLPVAFLQQGRFNLIALELLGPSLDSIFRECGRFSVARVAELGPQVIDCIEYVHRRGILHRDIKPANFLVGRGDNAKQVYLCDFGLSKKYLDNDGMHIPFRSSCGSTGTARYMSVVAHNGHEQGRRDDIESIGHMLLFLLCGRLPWQRLRTCKWQDRKKKHLAFYQAKLGVTLQELCAGQPRQMQEYMQYARALPFDATPDYNYLRRLLGSLNASDLLPPFDAAAAAAAAAVPAIRGGGGGSPTSVRESVPTRPGGVFLSQRPPV